MADKLFFNQESKSGTWEVTYDSDNDKVVLLYFNLAKNNFEYKIICTNKEFSELKEFIKNMKLMPNQEV